MCLVAQSCPTFCDPKDCSPPSSSVHGILQARTLEWVAISFSTPCPFVITNEVDDHHNRDPGEDRKSLERLTFPRSQSVGDAAGAPLHCPVLPPHP